MFRGVLGYGAARLPIAVDAVGVALRFLDDCPQRPVFAVEIRFSETDCAMVVR